jgi:hydrogenase maturation protease
MDTTPRILILGVGNLLWADEGFGVRCVEQFARSFQLPEHVTLVDGGTQGLALVPLVVAADRVLIFDAVEYGAPPAALVVARDEQVPGYIGSDKMSLHQAGVNDVLACVQLMGKAPERITLIGIQPVQLEDYGGTLTDAVRDRIGEALALAVDELALWGTTLTRRPDCAAGEAVVMAAALQTGPYELGRPDADVACRTGDDRVLASAQARLEAGGHPGLHATTGAPT